MTDALPMDIWSEIVWMLDVRSMMRLSQANRAFRIALRVHQRVGGSYTAFRRTICCKCFGGYYADDDIYILHGICSKCRRDRCCKCGSKTGHSWKRVYCGDDGLTYPICTKHLPLKCKACHGITMKLVDMSWTENKFKCDKCFLNNHDHIKFQIYPGWCYDD